MEIPSGLNKSNLGGQKGKNLVVMDMREVQLEISFRSVNQPCHWLDPTTLGLNRTPCHRQTVPGEPVSVSLQPPLMAFFLPHSLAKLAFT